MSCHLRVRRRASTPQLAPTVLLVASAVDVKALTLHVLAEGEVIRSDMKYFKRQDFESTFKIENELKSIRHLLYIYRGEGRATREILERFERVALPENEKWKVETTDGEKECLRIAADWKEQLKENPHLRLFKKDWLLIVNKLLFFEGVKRFWKSLRNLPETCKLLADFSDEAGRKLGDIDDLVADWHKHRNARVYRQACQRAFDQLSERQAVHRGLSEQHVKFLIRNLPLDDRQSTLQDYAQRYLPYCRDTYMDIPAAIHFLAIETDRLNLKAILDDYSKVTTAASVSTVSSHFQNHYSALRTITTRAKAVIIEGKLFKTQDRFRKLISVVAEEAQFFAKTEASADCSRAMPEGAGFQSSLFTSQQSGSDPSAAQYCETQPSALPSSSLPPLFTQLFFSLGTPPRRRTSESLLVPGKRQGHS